jgi:hypothetical protein
MTGHAARLTGGEDVERTLGSNGELQVARTHQAFTRKLGRFRNRMSGHRTDD